MSAIGAFRQITKGLLDKISTRDGAGGDSRYHYCHDEENEMYSLGMIGGNDEDDDEDDGYSEGGRGGYDDGKYGSGKTDLERSTSMTCREVTEALADDDDDDDEPYSQDSPETRVKRDTTTPAKTMPPEERRRMAKSYRQFRQQIQTIDGNISKLAGTIVDANVARVALQKLPHESANGSSGDRDRDARQVRLRALRNETRLWMAIVAQQVVAMDDWVVRMIDRRLQGERRTAAARQTRHDRRNQRGASRGREGWALSWPWAADPARADIELSERGTQQKARPTGRIDAEKMEEFFQTRINESRNMFFDNLETLKRDSTAICNDYIEYIQQAYRALNPAVTTRQLRIYMTDVSQPLLLPASGCPGARLDAAAQALARDVHYRRHDLQTLQECVAAIGRLFTGPLNQTLSMLRALERRRCGLLHAPLQSLREFLANKEHAVEAEREYREFCFWVAEDLQPYGSSFEARVEELLQEDDVCIDMEQGYGLDEDECSSCSESTDSSDYERDSIENAYVHYYRHLLGQYQDYQRIAAGAADVDTVDIADPATLLPVAQYYHGRHAHGYMDQGLVAWIKESAQGIMVSWKWPRLWLWTWSAPWLTGIFAGGVKLWGPQRHNVRRRTAAQGKGFLVVFMPVLGLFVAVVFIWVVSSGLEKEV